MCVISGRTPVLSGPGVPGFCVPQGWSGTRALRAEEGESPWLALDVICPNAPHSQSTPCLALLGCPCPEATVGAGKEWPSRGDIGRGESRARAGDRRLTETEEQQTRGLGSRVEGRGQSLKQELGGLCGRAMGAGRVGGRCCVASGAGEEAPWRVSVTQGGPQGLGEGARLRLTQDTLCPLCVAGV